MVSEKKKTTAHSVENVWVPVCKPSERCKNQGSCRNEYHIADGKFIMYYYESNQGQAGPTFNYSALLTTFAIMSN